MVGKTRMATIKTPAQRKGEMENVSSCQNVKVPESCWTVTKSYCTGQVKTVCFGGEKSSIISQSGSPSLLPSMNLCPLGLVGLLGGPEISLEFQNRRLLSDAGFVFCFLVSTILS
jgi:hypothetical protein